MSILSLAIGLVIGAIAGAIAAYFIIRNNPNKVAVANAAVNAVDAGAKSVATAVVDAAKKV